MADAGATLGAAAETVDTGNYLVALGHGVRFSRQLDDLDALAGSLPPWPPADRLVEQIENAISTARHGYNQVRDGIARGDQAAIEQGSATLQSGALMAALATSEASRLKAEHRWGC